jgi:hypothetical protein
VGAWSILIALGILVAFTGLFTHWSLIVVGALLPLIPVVVELAKRRRAATEKDPG